MDKEIGESWEVSERAADATHLRLKEKVALSVSADGTGHSEKQLDIKMDIQAGTWQDLKTSHPAQQNAEQKVREMYKLVSEELVSTVIRYFEQDGASDHKKATQRLREIRELRLAQDSLLNFLIDNKKKETDLTGEVAHLKLVVPSDFWIA